MGSAGGGDDAPMPAAAERAIILFAHGARDERWSATLFALLQRVQTQAPRAFVTQAFLEFQQPTLEAALAAAVARGCRRIEVAPVFWSNGGHVANDVPQILAAFRAAHPEVRLAQLPVLSELPGLLDFVAQAVVTSGSECGKPVRRPLA